MSRLLCTTIVLLMLTVSVPMAVAYQATPTSRDAPHCISDSLPPGTPVPITVILARGTESPEAQATAPRIPRIAIDVPPPSPPYDAVVLGGAPADAKTTTRVHGTIDTLFDCLWVHDSLGFATLVTPDYRIAAFGTANPYNAVMPLEGYPEVVVRSVDDVRIHEDGRLSADVVVVYHDTQVYRFRALFVDNGERLLLDDEIPMPFDNADVIVDVALDGTGLIFEPMVASSSTLIAFDVRNDLRVPATVSLIRLPAGIDANDLEVNPGIVERSAYMNSVLVPANEGASFAVADLEPATYTLVGVTLSADGEPVVPKGGYGSFTVELRSPDDD